jgi:hypothetical protein
MTIGLLDVALAPHRPNAAPAPPIALIITPARRAPSPWPCDEKGELLGRRANPSQTRRLASFGEFRVSAEKTLAGGMASRPVYRETSLSLAPSR